MPPLDLFSALDAGSLASVFAIAFAGATAWLLVRGGGGTALSSLREANQELERRVRDNGMKIEAQGGEIRDLKVENAELRGRTDFAAALAEALKPVLEWNGAHEERAQDRHDKTLIVLDLIAQRLGPDSENGSGDHH